MSVNTEVVVTGIGLISALGNLNETWESILKGKTAIKIKQPFPELDPFPVANLDLIPTNLEQLIIKIVKSTLKDAQLTPPLVNCGVIIGSSRGFQYILEDLITHQITNFTSQISTPYLNNLPNQCAIIANQIVGSQNIVLAPMAACATGIVAIARGFELIKMGECEQVLVGAVESPITPLTVAAFKKIGALAQTGCYPFDQKREGLVLGEGGAVFLLETKQLAQKRGVKIYGEILGFGLSCDATHISSPSISGNSAKKAILNCLKMSKLSNNQIQFIHPHGTSTLLNDQMEANLIQSLFPDGVTISSTKGATGHTLGASGALGLALTLKTLNTQIVPPCVGLTNPDYPLNFAFKPESKKVKQALCLSFGFGGQNGAIAVRR